MKKFFIVGLLFCLIYSDVYGYKIDVYNRAVEHINNYEIELGLRGMNKVIYSKTAPEPLKVKAYFWVAFIKLLDGYEEQVCSTIKEMLGNGMGLELDADDLPGELYQNAQLMEIYEEEKEDFLKEKRKLSKKISKHLGKAEKYYTSGKLDKAENALNKVLELDPENKDAGELKRKLHKRIVAVEDIEGRVDEYFEDIKDLYYKRDFDKADEKLNLLLIVQPNNQELIDLKSRIVEKRKQKKIVRKDMAKRLKRAQKLYIRGSFTRAKEELKLVLEAEPENQEAIDIVNRIQIAEIQKATIVGKVGDVDVIKEFNIVDSYNTAVSQINNYEIEAARRTMKKIIYSATALKGMKVKAYFWVAFLEVFDGNERKARRTVRSMLENVMDIDYEIKELPDELAQNAQLMEIYEEEKKIYLQKYKLPRAVTAGLKKAKTIYIGGNLDKADEILDRILEIEPEAHEAVALKNRIQEVRELRREVIRRLVEEFYKNAEYYYKSGDMMFAMRETNMALKLNPMCQKAYDLFQKAYDSLQEIMRNAHRKDLKRFQKAVNHYLEEEIEVAIKSFRKLQKSFPEAESLLSQAVALIQVKDNRMRARKYYKSAVKERKRGHYKKARGTLRLALAIDEYYIDALLLLEEVKLEIGD